MSKSRGPTNQRPDQSASGSSVAEDSKARKHGDPAKNSGLVWPKGEPNASSEGEGNRGGGRERGSAGKQENCEGPGAWLLSENRVEAVGRPAI